MKDEQKQAFIYQANGEIIPVMPKDGKFFTLKELQDIVKGYIEIVNLQDGRLMIVNEEGKLDGLKPNPEATKLYVHDYIVGDVLVTPQQYID
jgi:hypothetical protein